MFDSKIKSVKLLISMVKEIVYFLPLAHRATVKANRVGILTGREAAAFELSSGLRYMYLSQNRLDEYGDIDGKLAMDLNDFWRSLP